MKKDQSVRTSKPRATRVKASTPEAKRIKASTPESKRVKASTPETKLIPAEIKHEEPREIDRLMRLMTHQKGKAIQFEIAAKEDSKVYVAGTFNNWDPNTHPLECHPEDGVFRATINLPEGKHEYKFVVNGVWHLDTQCPHFVPNAHGTLNSVVHI